MCDFLTSGSCSVIKQSCISFSLFNHRDGVQRHPAAPPPPPSLSLSLSLTHPSFVLARSFPVITMPSVTPSLTPPNNNKCLLWVCSVRAGNQLFSAQQPHWHAETKAAVCSEASTPPVLASTSSSPLLCIYCVGSRMDAVEGDDASDGG